MQQITVDPLMVESLAASIQATGVVCMWIAGAMIVGAIPLFWFAIKEQSEGLIILAVATVLVAAAVIAVHADDVSAPQYEARKKLHNAIADSYRLPL